ncbi:hypothetical protein B0T21DRAFT_360662 [Apiosordaria backusii]|uniref:Uncharacterized protein n=1 Tax=Apiosordaria backusii TaxID=314023 RepID=A0AA40K1A7_9PEZI|nr:hypothetical protein B0T21DRAFT_360662 [Apiosordaria backusii]
MKFSPAILLLSASAPLALAIASPQEVNPGVPAPSGSGTPALALLRRQTPSNGTTTDNTVVNSRQRRALLRMRQEDAPTETVATSVATESAPAATGIPDDPAVEVPVNETALPVVETAAGGNGTTNGTVGVGNGTANGTASEEEAKMRRMVKIRLPDYRRDEEVREREVEAEQGVSFPWDLKRVE